MNEQEIVSYLKANRNQGIAYPFYPDAVKEWIDNHWYVIIEYRYNLISNFYHWVKHHDNEPAVASNDVYALPEDFELPPKPQSGWVEFKINKIGRFTDYNVDDDDHQISFSFGWHQWSEFLECSYEHGFGYTTFGGWQYKDSDSWLMTPRLAVISPNLTIYQDNYNPNNYAECECKPAIPVKIRFWRELK